MFIDFKLSVEKKIGNLTGGKFGPHIVVESAEGLSVGNDLTGVLSWTSWPFNQRLCTAVCYV